jgi:hypothetical protein
MARGGIYYEMVERQRRSMGVGELFEAGRED